jgi:hypothetical protein
MVEKALSFPYLTGPNRRLGIQAIVQALEDAVYRKSALVTEDFARTPDFKRTHSDKVWGV